MAVSPGIRLNNGVEMPQLGLGVYLSGSGSGTRNAVSWALEAGYRHIDTAAMYGNEREVGEAVRDSGVPRGEIFVTTKLWNSDHGYDRALHAFDKSYKALGLDRVDLYLIHWPVPGKRLDSWRAMQTLLADGRARAIGVSNFTARHLDELTGASDTVPAVNQVELHPFCQQAETVARCRELGIAVEAYSPLTKGHRLGERRIADLAAKAGCTPAQLMIRWSLQKGYVVIPKSSNRERIAENWGALDIELDAETMRAVDALDAEDHITWDPTDEP